MNATEEFHRLTLLRAASDHVGTLFTNPGKNQQDILAVQAAMDYLKELPPPLKYSAHSPTQKGAYWTKRGNAEFVTHLTGHEDELYSQDLEIYVTTAIEEGWRFAGPIAKPQS